MTVTEFEQKYKVLQQEGKEIYSELVPLFKRLQKLATKGFHLCNRANVDSHLYDKGTLDTLGWNIGVLIRLDELTWMKREGIDGIKNCLLNLRDQKFWTKPRRGQRK